MGTKPTPKSHKRQQESNLMRKSGMNFREIGEKLDISSARARNVYHETSLKIRINELESLLKRRGDGGG